MNLHTRKSNPLAAASAQLEVREIKSMGENQL